VQHGLQEQALKALDGTKRLLASAEGENKAVVEDRDKFKKLHSDLLVKHGLQEQELKALQENHATQAKELQDLVTEKKELTELAHGYTLLMTKGTEIASRLEAAQSDAERAQIVEEVMTTLFKRSA
jgi:hypothetical protein